MEKWPEGNTEDLQRGRPVEYCTWCGKPIHDSLWSLSSWSRYCSWRCTAAGSVEGGAICVFVGLMLFMVVAGDVYVYMHQTDTVRMVFALIGLLAAFVLLPLTFLSFGMKARTEVLQG